MRLGGLSTAAAAEAEKEAQAETAAAGMSFYQTVGLALIGIAVVVILVFVGINGVQATANFIIAVAQTGASALAGIGTSIAAQAQLLAKSASGTITSAASGAATAIANGVSAALNALLAVGGAVLNSISFGFQTVAEVLSDLGQQLVNLFLATVGSALIAVQTGLVGINAIVQIIQNFFTAFLYPVQLIVNFLTQPFSF